MRYPGMLRSDGSESEHYEDAQQVSHDNTVHVICLRKFNVKLRNAL